MLAVSEIEELDGFERVEIVDTARGEKRERLDQLFGIELESNLRHGALVRLFGTGRKPKTLQAHSAKNPFISTPGIARLRAVKVPCSAISLAAARKPVHAARASAPPTLMRRTPAAVTSATVVKPVETSTFTGFGATPSTTALMSLIARSPGA